MGQPLPVATIHTSCCLLLARALAALHIPVVQARGVDLHGGDVLLQEVQVLLDHRQQLEVVGKALLQQRHRLVQGVFQHHLGAEPEVHQLRRRIDGGPRVERVVELVVDLERRLVVALAEVANDVEVLLDVGDLDAETAELLALRQLHVLVLLQAVLERLHGGVEVAVGAKERVHAFYKGRLGDAPRVGLGRSAVSKEAPWPTATYFNTSAMVWRCRGVEA